jgi:tetratricopeptide (TPR) repeat protein
MKKYLHLIIVLPLLMVCSQKDTGEGIVKIGKTVISKAQMEAFNKITGMYPVDPGKYFPGLRSRITHLVETEVLYRNRDVARLRDSLEKTADWEWKLRYFPAQMYLLDFLSPNLGIPDEEISAYYDATKDSLFKVTVKGDSTKPDSTYYRDIADAKNEIVTTIFAARNKPDSAFLARFDSLPPQKELDQQWVGYIRQKLPNYFMTHLYKELTGTPYPDSLADIFGEGKFITQRDLDVIISWIPESRRGLYASDDHKRELVEWLVKWKVFSAISEKSGHNKTPEFKLAMDWARKLNAVYCYANTVLEPQLEKSISIDSSMLLYSLYDDNGYSPVDYSSSSFTNKVESTTKDLITMKLDSVIIGDRKKLSVTFLQNDWKDTRDDDPVELLKKADALRDSGKTNEARDGYLNLSNEFEFTPEGQTALVELAKLQTEQQLYSQAISNYRKFLLLSNDTGKRCNTFFMIGFIYDEYLDHPLHAEYNYKWVLQNTPECELADDAEFMMLHLDEPMSSVEELRDEALRQGRNVEPIDEEIATSKTK